MPSNFKLNDELIIAILSFLGGLLTFATSMRVQFSNTKGVIRSLRLQRQLKKAFLQADENQIRILQLLLSELKLYSSNMAKQATAISELNHIESLRAFEIFIDRFGRKPELTNTIRRVLMFEIRKLARVIY